VIVGIDAYLDFAHYDAIGLCSCTYTSRLKWQKEYPVCFRISPSKAIGKELFVLHETNADCAIGNFAGMLLSIQPACET
jgi:hypothetical protein